MADRTPPISRQAIALATLIEQTARNIYDQRGPAHLHPVQWSALRYFQRANSQVRTVAGLARYLGVTLGPASRTVSALKKNGLIGLLPNPKDARSSLINLTDDGRAALAQDPILRLARSLEQTTDADLDGLGLLLAAVNAGMKTRSTGSAEGNNG